MHHLPSPFHLSVRHHWLVEECTLLGPSSSAGMNTLLKAVALLAGPPFQQQAYPVAYPYMWNVPQWAPTTSMALFMPAMHAAPLQYAGQQRPDVPAAGSQAQACCCIWRGWHCRACR